MRLIDFHAHILPRADHGSDSTETSLTQLAAAERVGVEVIVATPHFYPDRHRSVASFLQRRKEAVQALRSAYSGGIEILPAAEVLLCEGLQNLPGIRELCVSGTRTLLVEMPDTTWPPHLEETLSALREEIGVRVVLAHVDRYPKSGVERLLRLGFAGQLNAESLCGVWTGRRFSALARTPSIAALGSDAHGRDGSYQKFDRAIRRLGAAVPELMERTEVLLERQEGLEKGEKA